MTNTNISVHGKKILTLPVKKETVSKSGLIIVENDIDKNIVEAKIVDIGNEVNIPLLTNSSKIFYLKSNCIEIKLNEILYHVINSDDILCSINEEVNE